MRGKETNNRSYFIGGIAMLILTSLPAFPLDLKSETLDRWDAYVKAVDTRNAERNVVGHRFLISDEIPGRANELRSGRIAVSPADARVPFAVPSGLIHDWIGAVFIPGATLSSVFSVIRDYGRYEQVYPPSVANVRLISTTEAKDRYSMILMNRSVVSKTALNTEYITYYTRLDDHRFYTVTDSIRVQEIAQYGTSTEHMLPEGHGSGLVWRLHTLTHYEERDGGVYLEIEAVALSRDIPAALRWFVEPIVRRVSRSSMANSLRQTQDAVRSHSQLLSTALR